MRARLVNERYDSPDVPAISPAEIEQMTKMERWKNKRA